MTRRQQTLVTALSIIIMALLLLVTGRIWTRIDLSSGKNNTLAPVSKNLHREINEPVRISYYCTGKLFTLEPVPGEIIDFLREYEARSRGKIQVALKDPSKGYSQDAERFGLTPQTLPNMLEDELSITTIYSGIVIEYLNRTEIIPWIFGLDTLEYDVTSRIRSLIRDTKREIGVISPDPGRSFSEYYGILHQVFAQSGISVLPLNPGEEIPDTLPALFVFGGVETLDDYSLYHIDRYIQLGGRVLFAVESVNVDFSYGWNVRLMEDSGLLAMIASYGAVVGQSMVMDKASIVIPYRSSAGQFAQARYPPWIGVSEENGGADNALTARFEGIDLYWASPLELALPETGNIAGKILFTSTPEAWLMTKDFNVNPEMAYIFNFEEEHTRGSKILAVSLEGIFPGRFAGMEKPETGDLPPLPNMPAQAKESRIVVVGDSDFPGNLIQFTQSQRNLDFALKAADWLGSDDDITGIRNRRDGGRLDRITDPLRRLGAMAFARILNIVIVPLAVIVFALIRILKRRPAGRRPEKELHDVA